MEAVRRAERRPDLRHAAGVGNTEVRGGRAALSQRTQLQQEQERRSGVSERTTEEIQNRGPMVYLRQEVRKYNKKVLLEEAEGCGRQSAR